MLLVGSHIYLNLQCRSISSHIYLGMLYLLKKKKKKKEREQTQAILNKLDFIAVVPVTVCEEVHGLANAVTNVI